MIIARDDKTWLYTVAENDGSKPRILSSVTTIIDSALGHFRGFSMKQLSEMLRASEDVGSREKVERITASAVYMMTKVRNAGEFGQAVHTLTVLDDSEDLATDILDPALLPILEAWRAFKTDHNPKMICSEYPIASRLGYAGTVDRVIQTNKAEMAILEIKSRQYMAGRDGLQTVAYQKAYEEMTKEKIKKRFVIELALDGTYKLTENKDSMDWDIFRSALAIHNWRKTYGI